MTLDGFTDTNLKQLIRYAEEKIERRLEQMETAVGKADFQNATQIVGCVDELRHIIFVAENTLRDRAKGA